MLWKSAGRARRRGLRGVVVFRVRSEMHNAVTGNLIAFREKTSFVLFVTRRCSSASRRGPIRTPKRALDVWFARFRGARSCFARITVLPRRAGEPSRSPAWSTFLVTPARTSETFVASAKSHPKCHVPRVARAADPLCAVPYRTGAEGRQHDPDGIPEIHREEDPGREVRARRLTAPTVPHAVAPFATVIF